MKSIEERMAEGRQYRGFDAAGLEYREDADAMTVTGYATVFNAPYEMHNDGEYIVMEEIDRRAFEGCDMSDVIMQYDHRGRVFARVSNGTLQVVPDEYGLHIRAELGGTDIGRDLYEEIKGGYTTKMSFGFIVGDDVRTVREENGVTIVTRTITKISKLFDVSAVSLPANDATVISARSFCDGVITEAKQEVLAKQERARKIQKIKIMCTI